MNTKQQIARIINRYGYLLPEGERVTNYQFADLLKKHFSINNPIVFKEWNWIRDNIELYWENHNNRIKVIKI